MSTAEDKLSQTQTLFVIPEGVLAPIDALEEIAPLLLDKERFAEDTSHVTSARVLLFSEIKAQAFTLQLACDWDEHTLLSRLGCNIDLYRDVVEDNVDLEESFLFMTLLSGLTEFLDARSERRAVVTELAALVRQLGCTTFQLKSVLDKGEPSSTELILLGEIDQACAQARWHGRAPRNWERTSALGPFMGAEQAHISTGRLDLLIDENFSVLGANVSKRMAQHVASCVACQEAVAARRAELITR